MKRPLLLTLSLLIAAAAAAQNWDAVRTSPDYYWGVGRGATVEEATNAALADMNAMIVTHVSSKFDALTTETHHGGGKIDHNTQVLNCVKTYSQSTLRNVKRMEPVGREPNVTMRVFMLRSELQKVFAERAERALSMVRIADETLAAGKVDMALQYYYWAYSLVRSLEQPTMARDAAGHTLIDWLPVRIKEVLADVSVAVDRREGDCVDLLFTYRGKPVSSLAFNYNDGRTRCTGSTAKDGRGMMEMVKGYTADAYHIDIEYEFCEQAQGDSEMESVLNVTGRVPFGMAEKAIDGTAVAAKTTSTAVAPVPAISSVGGATVPTVPTAGSPDADPTGIHLQPTAEQLPDDSQGYADILAKVIDAIATRRHTAVVTHFTAEGLDRYDRLIKYGSGRIVGTPRLTFFRSTDGHVVGRGLQMSFSFKTERKKTFVEDVVFTFNGEGRIDNVTFGLGQTAANDLLCKHPDWKVETREMLTEFLENYKTAYCLKDSAYIRQIFADDATIIVGHVAWRKSRPLTYEENPISIDGQRVITHNRYTKDQYINNLRRCFDRNEFINLRFGNNDIQWLDKYTNRELYGIQIGQEYQSSTYSDKGYLFLLVDMTDHHEPLIKVRTWQPNEVDTAKLYHAGYFYDE